MNMQGADSDAASQGPLILAVPSKGRLQEKASAFFAEAGLTLSRPGGARDYRGVIKGMDGVEVAFLSASEIARELAAGRVHLGVTGIDLVAESHNAPETVMLPVTPLGFGHADVVVAVPQAWIDVATMADLEDVAHAMRLRHGRQLRVATKYVRQTRRYFAQCGLADYRIVESLGATEVAPATGSADIIVDITTTGATLAANHLKILDDGVIERSQAHLVAARNAPWHAAQRDVLHVILSRMAAQARATDVREIRAMVNDPSRLGHIAQQRFACTTPFSAVGGFGLLTLHCPMANVWECVAWLRELKAETITVGQLDYVIEAEPPLVTSTFDALFGAQG